jgi:hypothetical protein
MRARIVSRNFQRAVTLTLFLSLEGRSGREAPGEGAPADSSMFIRRPLHQLAASPFSTLPNYREHSKAH